MRLMFRVALVASVATACGSDGHDEQRIEEVLGGLRADRAALEDEVGPNPLADIEATQAACEQRLDMADDLIDVAGRAPAEDLEDLLSRAGIEVRSALSTCADGDIQSTVDHFRRADELLGEATLLLDPNVD